MRLLSMLSVIVITVLAISWTAEAGKRIILVPLSSNEVYRLLREIGREDAVPQGRVVTQGIAAVSGFALGLTKGVGGALLFDLATSLLSTNQNQNQYQYLNQNQNQTVQTQEICFNSRSLNEINEDDAPQGRQTPTSGTGGTGTGGTATGTGGTATGTGGTNSGTLGTVTTVTNLNNGNGGNTNTQTLSTTQSGPAGAVSCLVIQRQPVNGS